MNWHEGLRCFSAWLTDVINGAILNPIYMEKGEKMRK